MWRPDSVEVSVVFWADEAVERYWLDNVAACPERKQAGRKEGQLSDCRRRACQVRQGITADERSSAVHAGLKLRNT
jgi:hypothetical protein